MWKYVLLAFFSWYMLAISSLLVVLQFQLVEYTEQQPRWKIGYLIQCFKFCFIFFPKWNDDANQFETMILLMLLPWIFVNGLFICEPGERVTNQFNQFGIKVERCKWNKLSIQMQKMYSIFLSDTQQAKNIQTYGGIRCTRQTLEQVFL